MASASLATLRMESGLGSEARCRSAPIFESTSRAGSRFGKTESVTATSVRAILLFKCFFHVLHHGEHHGPLAGNEHVLLEAAGLLEVRVAGEGLDGEVHVLFDFRGVLERVRAGDPHA